MDRLTHNFRNAQAILDTHSEEWGELDSTITEISTDRVVATQEAFASAGRRPKGGQRAFNQVFREELVPLGWEPEPLLFSKEEVELRGWKMDFYKERIGVEISFNHAEAIPWTFTRLNLAGESPRVKESHRIEVGVAIFATEQLKAWCRMDPAVGTYELAQAWLVEMKPILPIPILVIGLDRSGWPDVPVSIFPGTAKSAKVPPPVPEAAVIP